MKKYDVALALASTGNTDKLALARMIIDMLETNELYEPLKYKGSFEDLKKLTETECYKILEINYEERADKLEEEFELKNYDVALAYATAGKIEEARRVMEGLNPKEKLSISDIGYLEIKELRKMLEIWKTKNLHDRLFKWLKEKNLPQPEIPREDKEYFQEVVIGWRRFLNMRAPFPFITKSEYQKYYKRKLSETHPVIRVLQMRFVDYVCVIGNLVWIIEGKQKLNSKSITQITDYYELFSEDYPTFKVKKAIVCEDTNPKYENICREEGIKVFSLRS